MTNFITGIVGLLMVSIFLGFLVWWLKALPFTIIVVFVMLLALVDFVQSVRENAASRRRKRA